MMAAQPKQEYGPLKLLVDNSWIEFVSAENHDAYNPATGGAIAKVPFALKEEVDRAVNSAQEAFEKW